MSDLTNSKRVSYKATYVQARSTPAPAASTGGAGAAGSTGAAAGGQRTSGKVAGKAAERNQPPAAQHASRALEMAAFIQALEITPDELEKLREFRPDRRPAAVSTEQVNDALTAVGTLIADRSSVSTFRQAAAFIPVTPEALSYVASGLADLRQQLLGTVTRLVSDIVTAYRQSLVPPTPAPGSASAPSQQPPKLPDGTTSAASTTATGIPIVTTISVGAPLKSKKKPKTLSGTKRVHVRLDDAQAAPPAFHSVLAPVAVQSYTPSTEMAIAWAERSQPQLLANLIAQLQPHMQRSQQELTIEGAAAVVSNYLRNQFAAKTDRGNLDGLQKSVAERMTVNPIGTLYLERIEMYPAGVERGELLYSLPLTPGETVNVSHKEWAVTERDFTDIVQDSFEGYSEQGVAEKNDVAMSTESQTQHATALNVGASLSASYASVTLSTSFGFSSTYNESRSQKDSRDHSMAITKKASARTRKDHKTSFTVRSLVGTEDQSVRVITNASPTDTMRVDYYQLARKWKVDLLRYGMRMTYDIVIPNPGSGIMQLVEQAAGLAAKVEIPFAFTLPLSAIYYNSMASDPAQVSNYDQVAAQFGASVTAAPEARKWVNAEGHTEEVDDYEHVHFASIAFSIDENYYIYDTVVEYSWQYNDDHDDYYITMLDGTEIEQGINQFLGMSGDLSFDITYQYIYNYAINIIFVCRPKVQYLIDWRLQVWNQLRLAAQDQYNANLQGYKDQLADLQAQIASFDALTLRQMEQEEIMKGVLRWLLGPKFEFSPTDISSLFGNDLTDPGVTEVIDPNNLSKQNWMNVLAHGELIKFIHNAIEWENVLYFTYPYFWDNPKLWDFKKFLFHPDSTHRTFLRSGAARVVLTIRPHFEDAFAAVLSGTDFNSVSTNIAHPYVTIAQEMQNYANTNYPGFPPANPVENARPQLFLEQRLVWREMQFIIQLLNAAKAATGSFPPADANNTVPAAALTPYLDGPIVLNAINYNGINDYNIQANAAQIAAMPFTDPEDLLPTYTVVPINDAVWGHSYYYKSPGDSGEFDLICYGADNQPGGTDKDADISSNCEASLIATWYEYTPTPAMDIAVTMNPPNIVPPQPDSRIA